MRPSQLLAAVFAVSSVSNAMSVSDAFDNVHGLAQVRDVLFGRQNDGRPARSNNIYTHNADAIR